jgi:hypothetical protein
MMPNVKARVLEGILAKGEPKEADFSAIDKLADEILARHKEIGIVK